MTPTELWDIFYHAMKKWKPKSSDTEIRVYVARLMQVSTEIAITKEG